MRNLLRLEELTMFAFSIYLFSETPFAWWWYPLLILFPDIGMLAYLFNTRIGAFTYNLFHHKGLALLVLTLGYLIYQPGLVLAGIILFGHSSLDRVFGYGLKYADHFKHTHLGWLPEGKK